MNQKSQGIKNPSLCGAGRSIPLDVNTARELGGGARGRTLALIYRQLCYWSKYAKWRGSGGRKFFYKSQKELAAETGYSEKTINRVKKYAPENVTFLGFLKKTELIGYYKTSKFYLQLSRHEAFGVSVVEAMSYGCIPIVSNQYSINSEDC